VIEKLLHFWAMFSIKISYSLKKKKKKKKKKIKGVLFYNCFRKQFFCLIFYSFITFFCGSDFFTILVCTS
jgi:hypothetical protein